MEKKSFLENRGWLYGLVKALAFGSLFRFMHYWYEWWPNPVTAIVSGTGESVFQHFKIGFWALAILILVEALLVGKRIGWRPFAASRALSLSLVSWFNFVLWYAVASFGPLPTGPVELAVVIGMVFAMGFLIWALEKDTETIAWSVRGLVTVGLVLVLTAWVLIAWQWQTVLPADDVFAAPKG
ncbi:MAG: hypothetical protein WCG80_17165 [Spirochaetales bacterium]